MFCVSAIYENKPGAVFDFEYYRGKHLPMVMRILGTNWYKGEIYRGIAALDGSPAPYICLASIWIHSVESLQETLASHGSQIMSDIPNYTNLQPAIQISEVVA